MIHRRGGQRRREGEVYEPYTCDCTAFVHNPENCYNKNVKRLLIGLILLAGVVTILSFFFNVSQVGGRGMAPTIQPGDYIVSKRYLFFSPYPKRGDLVQYQEANHDFPSLGRVVVLPTEFFRFSHGNLYIQRPSGNYQVVEEYLSPQTKTRASLQDQWIQLDESEYLILKDNRENEVNIPLSRVTRANLLGQVIGHL